MSSPLIIAFAHWTTKEDFNSLLVAEKYCRVGTSLVISSPSLADAYSKLEPQKFAHSESNWSSSVDSLAWPH